MVVQKSHTNPPRANLVTSSFPWNGGGAGSARPYPPIFLGSCSMRNSRWPGLYQMPILPPVTLMMEGWCQLFSRSVPYIQVGDEEIEFPMLEGSVPISEQGRHGATDRGSVHESMRGREPWLGCSHSVGSLLAQASN